VRRSKEGGGGGEGYYLPLPVVDERLAPKVVKQLDRARPENVRNL